MFFKKAFILELPALVTDLLFSVKFEQTHIIIITKTTKAAAADEAFRVTEELSVFSVPGNIHHFC